MTVDREELRRLYEYRCWSHDDYARRNHRLIAAIPALLDDLDAKDKAIDRLVKDSTLEAASEAAKDRRIAELDASGLVLSDAINVAQNRIAELEAGLRDALRLADVPEHVQDDQWYADRESINKLLPSEET